MFTVMREKFLGFHAPLGVPVGTQLEQRRDIRGGQDLNTEFPLDVGQAGRGDGGGPRGLFF